MASLTREIKFYASDKQYKEFEKAKGKMIWRDLFLLWLEIVRKKDNGKNKKQKTRSRGRR